MTTKGTFPSTQYIIITSDEAVMDFLCGLSWTDGMTRLTFRRDEEGLLTFKTRNSKPFVLTAVRGCLRETGARLGRTIVSYTVAKKNGEWETVGGPVR